MPLFEFQCDRCELTFEELIRSQDTANCPTCGSSNVRKLLSSPAAGVRRNSGPLPVIGGKCPPSDAPPCGPGCCRIH